MHKTNQGSLESRVHSGSRFHQNTTAIIRNKAVCDCRMKKSKTFTSVSCFRKNLKGTKEKRNRAHRAGKELWVRTPHWRCGKHKCENMNMKQESLPRGCMPLRTGEKRYLHQSLQKVLLRNEVRWGLFL